MLSWPPKILKPPVENRGSSVPSVRDGDWQDKIFAYLKGPCTQELGTWDIGNSNYSADFG